MVLVLSPHMLGKGKELTTVQWRDVSIHWKILKMGMVKVSKGIGWIPTDTFFKSEWIAIFTPLPKSNQNQNKTWNHKGLRTQGIKEKWFFETRHYASAQHPDTVLANWNMQSLTEDKYFKETY